MSAPDGEVHVADEAALDAALRAARPGTTIVLAAGGWRGGRVLDGLAGTAQRPIVIRGADPEAPPRFEGGGSALHLRRVAHLELRDLAITRATGNGVNVDDGGDATTPSRHVALRRLHVTDIGERGNQDGLKLSGVADFTVDGCTIERWGAGGSGVDLVGCHRGRIEGSLFLQREGTMGSGVQAKGGSSEIVIHGCRFEEAGSRAVNLGGSTGFEFFRPPLGKPPHAEARAITVEHCTFRGSDSPIAFVGVDGAKVHHNTICEPRRWAIRILQETTAEGFVPCRNGEFFRNLVVFRSDRWSSGGVNVGGGTDPGSFTFRENWWYCNDAPDRSRPQLPVAEKAARHGVDPRLLDPTGGDLRLAPDSPARGYGTDLAPTGRLRDGA
jgi:hypothetical protein